MPSSDLRSCFENVGQLQGDHAKDWVVLAVAGISHSDCDDGGSPVSNETFCAGIEDGLTANSLCSSTVYL